MIEVLEFIFRSFWTWLGFTITAYVVFGSTYSIVTRLLVAARTKIRGEE